MMRIWLPAQRKMVGPDYGPEWRRYVIRLDGTVIGPQGQCVDAIVMRRTDMRDRNGRYIYYGDIVKLDNGAIIDVRYIGMSSVLAPAILRGECVVVGHIFDSPRAVHIATIPGVLRGTRDTEAH